jgi:hypothetical protein
MYKRCGKNESRHNCKGADEQSRAVGIKRIVNNVFEVKEGEGEVVGGIADSIFLANLEL